MKLSVCYVSHRPGWIDYLVHMIKNQKTNYEWELIVVDGCPGRVERGVVEQYLKAHDLPIRYYGKPKDKLFPWSRTGFANAMNTALIHATGNAAIFLHDYMVILSDAIDRWSTIFSVVNDSLVHGVAITYETTPPTLENDIFTNIPEMREWIPREPWVPEEFELGYWGGPLDFFEKCNGIDERADFCSEWSLDCVVTQAKLHNYKLLVDRTTVCHMIDHRVWHKEEDKDGIYKTFGTKSDIEHKPNWTKWSANDFNLRESRKEIRGSSLIESIQ